MTHNERLLALLDHEKGRFGVNWINCLEFALDTNGIKPDPKRLAPLLRVNLPSDKNQLRSVIESIQNYSRLIPRFAERASSLFQFISSNELTWI